MSQAAVIASVINVDRIVHEPARLIILTALASADEAEFKFLESLTGFTKGNLSSHIGKLEAAEYVEVKKRFRGKMPVTSLKITRQGRVALKKYREKLSVALKQA